MASVIVFTNGGAEAALLSVARGSGLMGSRLRPANLARMRRAMDPKLRAAIDDSYYVLAFCSRAQVEPSAGNKIVFDDAIEKIAHIQQKAQSASEFSDEDIRDFWKSFIVITNVCFPATVESIRYYFDGWIQDEDVRRTTRRWTLFFLILTIAGSLAWFIGRTALDQYIEDYEQYNTVAQLSRFSSEGQTLKATFDPTAKVYRVGVGEASPAVIEIKADRIAPILQFLPNILHRDQAPATATSNVKVPSPPTTAKTASTRGSRRVARTASADATQAIQTQSSPEFQKHSTEQALGATVDMTFLCDSTRESFAWKVFCSCNAKLLIQKRNIIIADQLVSHYANLDTDRKTLLMLTGPMERVYQAMAYVGLIPWEAALTSSYRPGRSEADMHCVPIGGSGAGNAAAAQGPASAEVAQLVANAQRVGPDLKEALLIYAGLLEIGRPMPVILPPPLESLASVQLKAHLALSVLNKYVLALLFGTLGACVHVMRDMNAQLERFTLVPSTIRRYPARIVLGAVAGPFIGLLFDSSGQLLTIGAGTSPAPALSTQLTPLAMAFVAGFSVEILFALLDRFIKVIKDFAYGDAPGPVRR